MRNDFLIGMKAGAAFTFIFGVVLFGDVSLPPAQTHTAPSSLVQAALVKLRIP